MFGIKKERENIQFSMEREAINNINMIIIKQL